MSEIVYCRLCLTRPRSPYVRLHGTDLIGVIQCKGEGSMVLVRWPRYDASDWRDLTELDLLGSLADV